MGGDGEQLQDTRRISSPEQLNDYLKVTSPKIWVLLSAVILLVAGLLLWSSFTTIESYATGTAQAVGGELVVTFDDPEKASKVQPGMEMEVGDVETEVLAVGTNENGDLIASARAHIPDGSYKVRVGYKATQVISMLLN
ncbi:MAG: hypothetical protein IJI35_10080 [Kiritimatiellae bacterium]|nr:hypothetical protein [Eggerthellaceae bacterium]MBQ6329350.1 hypothetical protein [Kiritimatiellia bacterium]